MELRIRNFPNEVHRLLKIRAAEESITLNELVIRLLREITTKKEFDRPESGR
jgi:predicted HicB family RNase H-like nuclease